MKEYFLGLISAVFLGGTLISLTPAGSYQKYMRLLCGLAVIGCTLFPVLSFIESQENAAESFEKLFEFDVSEGEDYDEIYNSSLASATVKNVEKTLKSLIIQEVSASDKDIDVKIIAGEKSGEYYIDYVEIIIHPSGILSDPRKIEKCVLETLGCECIIIYS